MAVDRETQGDHPATPENRSRAIRLPSARCDPKASVAMADWPANCAGGGVDRSDGARRLRVMLPLPLPEPLDYLMPDGASLPEHGSFVRVELGPRRLVGVVWDGNSGKVPVERLKPVLEVLPTAPLRPELRRF